MKLDDNEKKQMLELTLILTITIVAALIAAALAYQEGITL